MSLNDELAVMQSYAYTLELLSESLVNHDDMLECEQQSQLSFRNTAGIHHAIRIISRLLAERCDAVIEASGHASVGNLG